MRVDIGEGVRLYFDADGLGLVAGDGEMVDRPTVSMLHGGPGFDHSGYKASEMVDALRDLGQVVVYDHRGHGRSDRRPLDELTLDVWADDVVRLCAALEIDSPIVLGTSFGAMVAQRYLGRHPGHASKIILMSTVARWDLASIVDAFERLGGTEAGEAARAFFTDPGDTTREAYFRVCGPHYTQQPGSVFDAAASLVVRTPEVASHWFIGEGRTFDTRADLKRATCPVLVMAGVHDPITPLPGGEEIAATLPADLVTFERFEHSGHGVARDEPGRAIEVIRSFIES